MEVQLFTPIGERLGKHSVCDTEVVTSLRGKQDVRSFGDEVAALQFWRNVLWQLRTRVEGLDARAPRGRDGRGQRDERGGHRRDDHRRGDRDRRGSRRQGQRDQRRSGRRGNKGRRDEGPRPNGPPAPFTLLRQAATAWKGKGGDAGSAADEIEATLAKTRSLLNKLSRDNFAKLSTQLKEHEMTSLAMLRAVVGAIFDKALDEKHYGDMYADLCAVLSSNRDRWQIVTVRQRSDGQWEICHAKNPTADDVWVGECASKQAAIELATKASNFSILLARRAKQEFEREGVFDELDAEEASDRAQLAEGALTEREFAQRAKDREYKRHKVKNRLMGNIHFIGELYKAGFLAENWVWKCVERLLSPKGGGVLDPLDLEEVVALLTTVGKTLADTGTKQTRAQMKKAFAALGAARKQKSTPSRIRFAIDDLNDLRNNNWVPRHAEVKATTIAEFREQAQREAREEAKGGAGGWGRRGRAQPKRRTPAKPTRARVSRVAGGVDFDAADDDAIDLVAAEPARPPEPAAAGDRSEDGVSGEAEAPAPLSSDRLKTVVVNTFAEYVAGRRDDERAAAAEVVECLQPIAPSNPDLGRRVVVTALDAGLEKGDQERQAAASFLVLAAERGWVATEALKAALDDMWEFYVDILIDIPKQAEYTARMLAPLMLSGGDTMLETLKGCVTAAMRKGSHEDDLLGALEMEMRAAQTASAVDALLPGDAADDHSAVGGAGEEKSGGGAVEAGEVLSDEKLKTRVANTFDEFVAARDDDEVAAAQEAVACLLPVEDGSNRLGTRIVLTCMDVGLEKGDRERDAAAAFLVLAVEHGWITASSLKAALDDLWEFYVDILIDIPKQATYTAQVLAPMIIEGGEVMMATVRECITAEMKETGHASELESILNAEVVRVATEDADGADERSGDESDASGSDNSSEGEA